MNEQQRRLRALESIRAATQFVRRFEFDSLDDVPAILAELERTGHLDPLGVVMGVSRTLTNEEWCALAKDHYETWPAQRDAAEAARTVIESAKRI